MFFILTKINYAMISSLNIKMKVVSVILLTFIFNRFIIFTINHCIVSELILWVNIVYGSAPGFSHRPVHLSFGHTILILYTLKFQNLL